MSTEGVLSLSSTDAEPTTLREELFYQLGLRQFGRLTRIKLEPAIDLREVVAHAVNRSEGTEAAQMPPEQIVEVSRGVFALALSSPDLHSFTAHLCYARRSTRDARGVLRF